MDTAGLIRFRTCEGGPRTLPGAQRKGCVGLWHQVEDPQRKDAAEELPYPDWFLLGQASLEQSESESSAKTQRWSCTSQTKLGAGAKCPGEGCGLGDSAHGPHAQILAFLATDERLTRWCRSGVPQEPTG